MGMRKAPDRRLPPEEATLAFARAAAFFATVTVVAVLALLGSAQAASPPSAPPSAALGTASQEDEDRIASWRSSR